MSLNQYNWYPYKKRKLGHRHAQREDDVKTNREHLLQTKECLRLPQDRRGLEQIFPPSALRKKKTPADSLISDF